MSDQGNLREEIAKAMFEEDEAFHRSMDAGRGKRAWDSYDVRHDQRAYFRRADAVLKLIEGREKWGPIETAPRDGTQVLLWCKTWERGPAIGWTYGDDPWQEIPDRLDRPERRPTRWQHLPSPPDQDQTP